MPGSLSLFSVNAVLVMSADDGSRIFTKYYSPPHPPAGTAPNATDYPGANPYPTVKEQKSFEQGLLEKTNKQTSDVILYDNRIVVFKMESDVMLYVVGSAEDNEVLLYNVVLSLRDALGILFKYVSSFFFKRVPGGKRDPKLIAKGRHGQTHHHRKLRPSYPSHRRDYRRRDYPRDGPGSDRLASQQGSCS